MTKFFEMRAMWSIVYLLQRDFLVLRTYWVRLVLNYIVFMPCALSFSFGYIMPHGILEDHSLIARTIFFVGSILWALFPLSYILNVDLLYDCEQNKAVNFLVLTVGLPGIIFERILFSTLVAWATVVWYYPVAFFLAGLVYPTSLRQIFLLNGMLFAGALMCSAFNICVVSFLKKNKTSSFWMRINNPLIMLGGFFVSWHTVMRFSSLFGMALLANPLLYITEGIKASLVSNGPYIPVSICSSVLISYAIIFGIAAHYFLKRKMDYI